LKPWAESSSPLGFGAKISGAKEVRIEALVSRGGTANAAPGDLVGSSLPMAPGAADVALTIDRVRP